MKEAAVKMAAVKMEAVKSAVAWGLGAVKVEVGADWCRHRLLKPGVYVRSDHHAYTPEEAHIYKGICSGTLGLHWWQPVTNAMARCLSDSHPKVGSASGRGVHCQDKQT